MIRTISIGSTLQVQGTSVGTAADGKLLVRVGSRVFAGQPVPRWSSQPPAVAAQRTEAAPLNIS